MKAIVYTQYGSPDVLQYTTAAKPTPKDNEVLIRVSAASLNIADSFHIRGIPFMIRLMTGGLRRPRYSIPGSDMAGVVEAVGSKVTRFKPGDAVLGDLSGSGLGAFAEYVCAKETLLAFKPASVSFEDAAAVPMAAVTALQGLRDKGQIQPGQKVAINGASGGVGTFAVQIAKALGAEVTAICSTAKIDLMRSIGADHVIDYTQEDFTRGSEKYDLIVSANGYHPLRHYRRALRPGGRYVNTGGSGKQIAEALLLGPLLSLFRRKKLMALMAQPKASDLDFVAGLLATGKVKPVIDRCYPLSETADAVRYLEQKHTRGKIVISMEGIGKS